MLTSEISDTGISVFFFNEVSVSALTLLIECQLGIQPAKIPRL